MTTIFSVFEVSKEGDLTRVRGRAERAVSVEDRGIYHAEDGTQIPVSIVRIETYGRETPTLDQMWTADLLLSSSGAELVSPGKIVASAGESIQDP